MPVRAIRTEAAQVKRSLDGPGVCEGLLTDNQTTGRGDLDSETQPPLRFPPADMEARGMGERFDQRQGYPLEDSFFGTQQHQSGHRDAGEDRAPDERGGGAEATPE